MPSRLAGLLRPSLLLGLLLGGSAQLGTGLAQELVEEPGYLGLIADDRQDEEGVRIVEILPQSPAADGGLQVDDLLVTINDHPIRDMADMAHIMQRSRVGTELVFSVERDRQFRNFRVTLAERPAPEQRPFQDFGKINSEPGERTANSGNAAGPPWLGIRARTLPEDLAGRDRMPAAGVFVTEVMQGGPADRAGLRPGNVIVALNGVPLNSSAQLSQLVSGLQVGQEYSLDFIRDGQPDQTAITVSVRGDYQAGPSEFPGGPSRPIPNLPPLGPVTPGSNATSPSSDSRGEQNTDRLEAMQRQIDSLQQRLDRIEQLLQTLVNQ